MRESSRHQLGDPVVVQKPERGRKNITVVKQESVVSVRKHSEGSHSPKIDLLD